MYAICLKCGAKKKLPGHQCGQCGFRPQDDESMEKSVYLSSRRYDDPAGQSKYENELRKLASELRSGREIKFDVKDLDRLCRQRIEMEAVTVAKTFGYLHQVFFPGLLFLLVLIGLLILLKLR